MSLKVYSSNEVTLDVIKAAKETAPVIGTHNGTFHCDEVTACVLLKSLDKWKNSTIVRTRDNQLLQQCDIVVDTGHEYDPEKQRFDHHHKGFQVTWSENKTTTNLSSAGLIFKHFGKDILHDVLDVDFKDCDFLQNELYDLIFEQIDAHDNGVRNCDCSTKAFRGGMPGYGSLIASANTSWIIPEQQDETIFSQNYLNAKKEFTQAIENRHKIHPSKLIITVERHYRFAKYLPRFFVPTSSDDVAPKIVVWKEPWGDSATGEDWVATIVPEWCTFRDESLTFPTKEELSQNDSIKSRLSGIITVTKTRLVCDSRDCVFAVLEKIVTS